MTSQLSFASAESRVMRLVAESDAQNAEPREVIARKPARCDGCRRDIVPGETCLTVEVSFKKGAAWFRRRLGTCCYSRDEVPADRRVSMLRLAAWNAAHQRSIQTGRRGRPRVHLDEAERALVLRLRAEGNGELRVARLFGEETGRRISPRTLARIR